MCIQCKFLVPLVGFSLCLHRMKLLVHTINTAHVVIVRFDKGWLDDWVSILIGFPGINHCGIVNRRKHKNHFWFFVGLVFPCPEFAGKEFLHWQQVRISITGHDFSLVERCLTFLKYSIFYLAAITLSVFFIVPQR